MNAHPFVACVLGLALPESQMSNDREPNRRAR
jgi:hypothetical protein